MDIFVTSVASISRLPSVPKVSCARVLAEAAKVARASSEVRILSAFSMPSSCSVRRRARSSHSFDLPLHESRAVSKKSSSILSWAWVAERSSSFSESMVDFSAFWPSLSVTSAVQSATCFSFSAMRSSNAFCLADSSLFDFSRSAEKVSYMSLRIPMGGEECDVLSGNVKLAMSHVVPDLVQKVIKGQDPLHILGSGMQRRHYTYAGDLAMGIVRATLDPRALNDDFNVSTPIGHTVLELGEEIWEMLNPGVPFAVTSDDPFEYDVQCRIPDVGKAAAKLGITCPTNLRTTLDEVVPWIREQVKLGTI